MFFYFGVLTAIFGVYDRKLVFKAPILVLKTPTFANNFEMLVLLLQTAKSVFNALLN